MGLPVVITSSIPYTQAYAATAQGILINHLSMTCMDWSELKKSTIHANRWVIAGATAYVLSDVISLNSDVLQIGLIIALVGVGAVWEFGVRMVVRHLLNDGDPVM